MNRDRPSRPWSFVVFNILLSKDERDELIGPEYSNAGGRRVGYFTSWSCIRLRRFVRFGGLWNEYPLRWVDVLKRSSLHPECYHLTGRVKVNCCIVSGEKSTNHWAVEFTCGPARWSVVSLQLASICPREICAIEIISCFYQKKTKRAVDNFHNRPRNYHIKTHVFGWMHFKY